MVNNHKYNLLWDKKYLKLSNIEEVSELKLLKTRLNLSNARQILYHAIYNIDTVPICKCGVNLKWNNDLRAYRLYCSKKCTAKFSIDSRKETCLAKYGVDHFSKTKEFSENIKQTSLEKFGVTHYSKTEDYKQSVITSNLKKYGTNYAMQNIDIVNACKQHWVDTIGSDNPAR